jgi:hypothetical protein
VLPLDIDAHHAHLDHIARFDHVARVLHKIDLPSKADTRSSSGSSGAAKDLLGPVERLELSPIAGKCLVGTNDEKSPRGKSGRDPLQDTFLQVGGKVG